MDRVVGLEWGADDYVTKSTPLAELIARIRAVLRRTGRGAQTTTADSSAALIKFDGWTLSTESGGLISHAGERTPLTQGELAVMVLLAQNLGRVVSRSDLMLALSGREWSGTERSVDVIISRLRGKLGDPPRRPKRLMTVHGTGYRLVG
jgi:DNA-binding response OmpR family regulator